MNKADFSTWVWWVMVDSDEKMLLRLLSWGMEIRYMYLHM